MKNKALQLLSRLKPYLNRFSVYIPAVFFLSGFAWDVLTIGRHVTVFDLLILSAYLLSASALIYSMNHPDFVLENLLEYWSHQHAQLAWLSAPNLPYFILQFLFGSILSALFILYFQSASHLYALMSVAIIGGLLVANEFFASEYKRLTLSWALLGLCAILLCNFALPFLMGSINAMWFYISTVLGACLVVLVYYNMHHHSGSILPVGLVAGLLMGAYHFNMIPPVPLVKRDLTMGYYVHKEEGRYAVTQTPSPWWQFWRNTPDDLYYVDGQRIYCFSSVFAPIGLQTQLSHNWQFHTVNGWVTYSDIAFEMKGGRSGGYRGYTYKQNLKPGKWRVRLESQTNKTIAIRYFTLHKGVAETDRNIRYY